MDQPNAGAKRHIFHRDEMWGLWGPAPRLIRFSPQNDPLQLQRSNNLSVLPCWMRKSIDDPHSHHSPSLHAFVFNPSFVRDVMLAIAWAKDDTCLTRIVCSSDWQFPHFIGLCSAEINGGISSLKMCCRGLWIYWIWMGSTCGGFTHLQL